MPEEGARRLESTSYPLLRVLAEAWQPLLVLLLVWFLGTFGFSVTWLLGAFALHVWRTQSQRSRELRHRMRAAIANDEKAFLATVDDLPSWVYFPDKEKAQWLNNILKQMWPFVNDYVSNLLQTQIGPKIASAMPGPFKGFRFLQTDLGDVAPRIGGVKVYSEQLHRDEVIIDIELFYAGDCNIHVTVGKKLNAGISDLTVSGTLRVVFSPLVTQMPLIGAVQAFFLNRPHIDFNLKSLANAFDVPGLSDMLRKIATDQVAAIMVLPNKIKVPLVENLDPVRVTYILPKSVLRVCVINAKDLKRADFALIGKGSSDPFVVVRVGAVEYETKVQKKTVDPIWNEWFEFILDTSPYGREIEFEVFDYDSADKNDKLGTMEIDLEEVAKKGCIDSQWMPLEGVDRGVLHVSAELLQLSDEKSMLDKVDPGPTAEAQTSAASKHLDDRPLTSCIVSVQLDGAKCLPTPSKNLSEPDPMAVIRVGNEAQESCVKQDTATPRWEEHFLFRCRNVALQNVEIEIFDKRKSKKLLGRLSVALRSVIDYPGMNTMQWYPLTDSGPDSQLHLGLCVRALVSSDKAPAPDLTDMAGHPLLAAFHGPSASDDDEDDESEPSSPVPETGAGIGAGSSVAIVSPQLADAKPDSSKGSEDLDSITNISELRRRIQESNWRPPTVEDKGFGKLQMTLRYSSQRQKLIVVLHQCVNLVPCDSDNLADPYVRVYLLPDKSQREQTQVRKDTLNPVFDETFEFAVSQKDLSSRTLQIAVKNKNSFFSKARKEMGEISVPLEELASALGMTTEWYDLESPDGKRKRLSRQPHKVH